MLTATELTELEAIASKQPLVKKLLDEYLIFAASPYLNSYIAHITQLTHWDNESINNPISITGNDEEKAFDRQLKYSLERYKLLTIGDEIRMKMTPQQLKDADKELKLSKSKAVIIK